jgi:hypothetical protein
MDDEEALRFIELPRETIYLIDKVVRQKAKAGPIGIDNSEFINLQIEEEYKQKNKHINQLTEGYRNKKDGDLSKVDRTLGEDDEDDSDQENNNDGDKENQDNQRLLDRLSTAAARIPTQSNANLATTIHGNQSHISGGAGGQPQSTMRSKIGEKSQSAVSHEEWMRKKEHSVKLKEQLIKEAKRDILEQVRRHQAMEELRHQQKQMALLEWEERKRQDEEMKKMEKYRKEEDDRLQK